MKLPRKLSSQFKPLVASALLVAGCVLPASAINVLVSGTGAADDQPLIDFLNNNFEDVNLTYGDFSDYVTHAATIEAADLFVVGRRLGSGAYGNAANSASFNALTIPVVSFTSYVTRSLGSRWGWHDGDTVFGAAVDGAETTVTAAGAGVFGLAEGAYDWFPGTGGTFNAAGSGSVGDGEILATIAGNIVAAHWNAGDLSGSGVAFGGERLLFNLSQVANLTIMPTGAGEQALIAALVAYTPLQVADAAFTTSPQNNATLVAVDTDIVVTATDIGVTMATLVTNFQMQVNASVVSGVVSNSNNGVMTFTYSPPTDLAHDTIYAVQLDILRSDDVTNTINFSFTTIPDNTVHVLVSGTSAANDQSIISFLTNNFQNVAVTYGNFSDYPTHAATIQAADVVMVGRSFSSAAYANSVNSASFNALTNPVVAFSSFLTRPLENRWGWHNGDVVVGASVVGAETTVTAAGASVFGVAAGIYDWVPEGGGFNAAGSGSIGDGQVLATIAGEILAAHWSAGEVSGTGVAFGGERLLFNLSQVGAPTIIPTGAGQLALIKALDAYTPLVPKDPIALTPTISPGNSAFAGETPVISAVAAGTGPLTYQWQWDQGLGGEFSNIPGATSQNYTQDTSALGGIYSYQFIVTNNLGNAATSSVAVLTVNPPQAPFVVTDTTPFSTNAYVTSTATFTAAFDGSRPMTNQWQFSSDFAVTWSNLAEQTNTTLTLTNLQAANEGYYRLEAANFLGTNWSSPALLTVLAAPPSSGDAAADVLAMNPVAYWPLNDLTVPSSGDAPMYDASGNGHSGAYSLNALNASSGIVGPQAADGFPQFAASQGALTVSPDATPSWATAPALNLNTNTVTISAWVWPDGVQSNFAGIFMNRNAGSIGGLHVGETNELRYTWVTDDAAQWGHSTGLVLPTNQWSFVALVVAPTSTTWYLHNTNGLQTHNYVINNPVMPWTGATANIRIGNDQGTAARAWRGSIDEVAVFNRALSQTEVLLLADVAAPPTLSISQSGHNVVVSWTAGTLLEAASVTGPWTTNSAAVSPYTNAATGTQRFFRTQVP